ncbi:MAG TPA: GAF domain-containing sensor histidine kinase [bacterium]|nr:GAF domain-containing sensor histidine kinase [bacterium]
MDERQLNKYFKALKNLKAGNYNLQLESSSDPALDKLGRLIDQVGNSFHQKLERSNKLFKLTEQVNEGVNLDEIWNHVYDAFQEIIPYNRIGVARLEDEGETVVSCWARSDEEKVKLQAGYQSPLEGSSLQKIIKTGQPRILNDLEQYLEEHPNSHSTKLIVSEGMRSSLTCPMYAMNRPTGFIFFSSRHKNTYKNAHVGVFQQVSNHLSMIVEKSRIMQRLRELDDLKNQFLGIAAHDLKSPINVINNYINIWKQGYYGDYDEQQKKSLDIMERNCNRMRTLIDDLLDLSAIESGKIEINKEQVNLNEIILNYYVTNKSMAEKKSINLELDLPEELPDIQADKDRIIQVIDNYVSNAVKYSESDTKVTLGAKILKDSIQVYVKDQGPGIPKKKQDKLFTRFGKVGIKPTGKEKSTGLGLYITKIIIDGHGGEVGVQSEEGQGSLFYFRLPLD